MVATDQGCRCSVPPGKTYSHCRSCCTSFASMTLWDLHRAVGDCWELDGIVPDSRGVLDTPEGIAAREAFGTRVRQAKSA